MYEFERLVICRELRVSDGGRISFVDASYEFGAAVRYLFVVGRVSAPQWRPDLTFNLSVLSHRGEAPELKHTKDFSLIHPPVLGRPRLLVAGFAVSGILLLGYHDAVITFPGFDPVSAGFKIV